jgi:hypothetical protein
MGHHEHDRNEHDVKITVRHHGHHVQATAQMRWRHCDLTGVGRAEVDPDAGYPERVGDELATARALTHLTRQMFVTTPGDVVSVTGDET